MRDLPAEVPPDLRVFVAAGNSIGESPLWSVRDEALYWVDVEGRHVHRYRADTGERSQWDMPEPTGCIGLRKAGGLVAATRRGFVFVDTASGAITPIADPESDLEGNRFNDGKADRRGRFFAGTKNIANRPDLTGSIYRLGADLGVERVAEGISCVNGIAWSPDDRTVYYCDTWLRRIYVCAFDAAAGSFGERRLFAQLSTQDGYPDGLTVDAEGYVWNAHYDGWRITRYAPDGRIERRVGLPVQHVTSLTFGGAELRTLFVTSASMRLPPEARVHQPLAGHVFAFEPGPAGLPEPQFAG